MGNKEKIIIKEKLECDNCKFKLYQTLNNK